MGCREEDKRIEEDLFLLGNEFVSHSSSIQQLNSFLDELDSCLKRVDQSRSKLLQGALDPLMKKLGAKELLYHPDMDVKVSVASCFNQILRIKAPNVPYEDEQMKEIIQLIVAAFENLSDTSSPSYCKRVSILDTVADFGSWNLMVNLQCRSSIVEMFKHFLTNMRQYHPIDVFTSMGLIMVMTLEKLEEIPPEIICLLSDTVRKENQNVLPIARDLGERVIESCNSKLMSYMRQADQCTKVNLAEKSTGIELQDSPLVDKDTEKSSEVQKKWGRKRKKGDEKVSEEENQEEVVVEKSKIEARKEQEPVVDKNVGKDREEISKEQVCEEESGEGGEQEQEKVLEEGTVFLGETVREKRRKGSKKNQNLVVDESSQDWASEEEGSSSEEELVKPKGKKRNKKDENGQGQKKPVNKGRQVIKTRCSQHQMHEFLSNLEGKKRSIIQNSIFSPFLDIPKCPLRPSMAHSLIERYDAEMDAFILAGKPLKFCDKEVEKCIGLSFEGKKVNFQKGYTSPQLVRKYFEMVVGDSKTADDSDDSGGAIKKRKFEEPKANSFAISSNMLLQKLKKMKVDEKSEADDFLRLSILFMFNVYFFSSNNIYVNQWPLEYLEKLEDMGSYAWGRAAYDYLRMSMEKASGQLKAMKEIHTYLNGCIPLLETLAYERIKSLKLEVHQNNLKPFVLKYKKGEGRSLNKIRRLLANLKPDEIKKCKDCVDILEEVASSDDPMSRRLREQREQGSVNLQS